MINNFEQPENIPNLEAKDGLTGKYDAVSMSLKFAPENFKGEGRVVFGAALNHEGLSLDDQLCKKGFFEAISRGLDEDARDEGMKKVSTLLSDIKITTDTQLRKNFAKELAVYLGSL